MNDSQSGGETPLPIQFSPESHSFNVSVAAMCGLEAATVFNHIFFWIKHNRLQGLNQHEDRTWMFQTMEQMVEYLPYLTFKQIRGALDKLYESGLLLKGNFATNQWKRTSWYALADESWIIGPTSTFGPFAQKGKSICPKGQMHVPKKANEYKDKDRDIRWEKEDTHTAAAAASSVSPVSSSSQPEVSPKQPKSQQQPIPRALDVLLTDDEHQKLLDRYPSEFVQACYDFLADWKASATPAQVKRHKSDYRRITTWVINAVREKQLKERELNQRESRANGTPNRRNSKLHIPEDDKPDSFDWRSKIPPELRGEYEAWENRK